MNSASFLHSRHPKAAPERSWFKDAFPVPKILAPAPVAVEVCDGYLRFFELARSRKSLRPKAFGSITFPPFDPSRNEGSDGREAAAALAAWSKQTGYESVRVIIHEDEAYAFRLALPVTRRSAVRGAIEALLEENVPIPPSETVFEYDVMGVDPQLGETEVAVAAISEKSLREYLDLFKAAGMTVTALDTESRAAARALFKRDDTGIHAVLSISSKHSSVFVVKAGSVVFSSSVPTGSNDIAAALSKTKGISEGEAKRLKDEKASREGDESAELFEAMLPALSAIRDELAKVLAYWKTQAKKERDFKDIEDIVIVGKDASVAGLAHYLSSTTRLPVKIGDVWTNVLSVDEHLPELTREESLDYAALIGALI